MQTADKVLAKIKADAEKCTPDPRFVRSMTMKDRAEQGDVYLVLKPDDTQAGEKLGTRQVAVGNTVGARHVAEGDVVVYRRPGAGPLEGPIVSAADRWTLTHPEHAHVSLPAGDYCVYYQQDLQEEEMRAVMD